MLQGEGQMYSQFKQIIFVTVASLSCVIKTKKRFSTNFNDKIIETSGPNIMGEKF